MTTPILHSDGGSRGNPGPAGIGFTLEIEGDVVLAGGAFIGDTTNNVAEYEALIWGIENALVHGAKQLDLFADSELMVKQLTGSYKIKNEGLKALAAHAHELLGRLESWTLTHTLRAGNKQADALVNEALDNRAQVGTVAVDYQAQPSSLFDLQPAAEPSLSQKEVTTMVQDQIIGAKQPSAQTPGTYTLTVKDHFDAAHSLYDYPGKCRNLHGHTWDIEVTVSSRELDAIGIVYDFKDLKEALHTILDAYDHHHINEVPPFDVISPTAENLARIISDRLTEVLDPRVNLDEVVVWESPVARLAFRADSVQQ